MAWLAIEKAIQRPHGDQVELCTASVIEAKLCPISARMSDIIEAEMA